MVKWFRFLFWLVIPNIIASILTIDSFQETAPGIYLLGGILAAVSTLAYGIVLQHLRDANAKYFTAGCCKIVVGGLSLLKVLVLNEIPFLNVGATLISAVVSVCAVHEEYTAHSEALRGVDDDLADKWLILWKAYIILLACTLGSIVLALFAPGLGVLALLGGSIGLTIVGIIELVCLYSSAKALRFHNTYFVESV